MSNRKLIAITGGTGKQGGSVARFLLQSDAFDVRVITRNVDSAKAKELALKGADVVKADIDNLESITEAFEGVYGVFGVTNYWEHMNGQKEIQQGKNLVDAAEKQGVQHFVWSTVEETVDGVAEHFYSKFVIDNHLKASSLPRTSLYTPFFFENFTNVWSVTKSDDGKIVADWPILWSDGPIVAFSAADTGAFVLEAFLHPDKWIGNDMRIGAEIITPRQFVQTLQSISGKEIELKEVTKDAFYSLQEISKTQPFLKEVWPNMNHFYIHEGNPGRDLELTKNLYPQRTLLKDFVQKNLGELLPK